MPLLTDFFIKKYNTRFNKAVTGISEGAIDILTSYHWPGNIRELENLIERLVVMSDGQEIAEEDIPVEFHLSVLDKRKNQTNETSMLNMAVETFERNYILKTLEKVKWSRKDAAETLGIPISTLKYKLEKLKLYDVIKLKESA